jgi:hypothetical protein
MQPASVRLWRIYRRLLASSSAVVQPGSNEAPAAVPCPPFRLAAVETAIVAGRRRVRREQIAHPELEGPSWASHRVDRPAVSQYVTLGAQQAAGKEGRAACEMSSPS